LDKHPNKKIVFISCNGDWKIDKPLFENRSECIKVWFSQNADYNHPDLIPIPIGLENDFGPSKGRYTDYSYLNTVISSGINNKNRAKQKIYCNFNIKNNQADRTAALKHISDSNLISLSSRRDYSAYCEDIMNHMFIASPNGNGIDCHRTWEALYLGAVPIVQSHFMFDHYKGLPIIRVDNYNEINKEWIERKIDWYNSNEFEYKYMKLSYWGQRFKEESSKL